MPRTQEQVDLIYRSRDLFREIGEVTEPEWGEIVDRVIGVDGTVACRCSEDGVYNTQNPYWTHGNILTPRHGTDCVADYDHLGSGDYFEHVGDPDKCWADIYLERAYGIMTTCNEPSHFESGLCVGCGVAMQGGHRRAGASRGRSRNDISQLEAALDVYMDAVREQLNQSHGIMDLIRGFVQTAEPFVVVHHAVMDDQPRSWGELAARYDRSIWYDPPLPEPPAIRLDTPTA